MLEAITQGLAKIGYRVVIVRNIPETDFILDTNMKDTWRHAEGGEKTVLNLLLSELIIIRKIDTAKYHLCDLVKNLNEEELMF